MQKPKGYDSVSVGGGGFQPINPGGHYMVILQVKEKQNNKGGDMLVVAFEFDGRDEQKGYFKRLFDTDPKIDKKWPNSGTNYINVLDQSGNCSKSFKSFCVCVESSNGIKIDWDAQDFCAQFKGKRIGGVFGKNEHNWNGKTTMRTELRYFVEYNRVADAKVPEPRMSKTATANTPPTPVDEDAPF